MQKGNRLAAMIMAAVLAAGTLTGPVFAADYTTTGEILTEEGSYDYSSENGGLTDETVQENSALSIAPASEMDSSVSESNIYYKTKQKLQVSQEIFHIS